MKKLFFLLTFVVSSALFACSNYYASLQEAKPNIPISEFILGKWDGSGDIVEANDSKKIVYMLNFKSKSSFDFVRTSPDTDVYDDSDEYTYRFTSEDIIQVNNRRVSNKYDWKIERHDEKLRVCFSQSDCVLFARKADLTWWWIFIPLAIIIGLFVYRNFKKRVGVK